jgi:hypothetical protein
LGKGSADPDCNIISKIFTKENGPGNFRPVQFGPGIQIAEIMTGAHAKSKFAFLHNSVLGQNGSAGEENNSKKGDNRDNLFRHKAKM